MAKRRLTIARKPKPPAIDRAASVYAAKLGAAMRPLLALVNKTVLPMVDPNFRSDAPAALETIVEAFAKIRVGFLGTLARAARLGANAAHRGADSQNRDEFRRVLRVDPFDAEPWLKPLAEDWVTENVSLVRSVASSALGDLETAILRMTREGESRKDIREEIARVFNLNANRAKLIARDQVNKFNGQLTKERQTRLGVAEYIWHTSEDVRVRPDHARLDGKVFEWSDPPITVRGGSRAGERNHPGGDIQCRCWAEPVLEGVLAA